MSKPKKQTKVIPTESFASMEVADGANDIAPVGKPAPRTIQDVLAGGQRKQMGQSISEYTIFLNSMSLAELQHHAYSKQMMPISNRRLLEQRLLTEFERERIQGSVVSQPSEPFDTSKKKRDVLDILARGR